MNTWSKELQADTKDILDGCRFGAIDGLCHLKKWAEIGTISGAISLQDALAQNWIIKNPDDDTDILNTYSDIDSLVEDGWAID